MAKLAEAYVDIGANLKPLEAGLARAKTSLASFAKVGVTLGVGAGAGAGAGLLKLATQASDLAESLSKVRVTFGRDSEVIIENANTLASKFGVVKQEALDAAAGFGLMGRAAGLSTQSAAKLGSEFVQLGVDLASFHNIANEAAFEKLRSGLAGESEPLRQLGIMLSEDAVKAKAAQMGLASVNSVLTDQQKILARIALIKEQAGPAGGDMERTLGGNAQQMKKLMGDMKNLATDFGNELQGAFAKGLAAGQSMLSLVRVIKQFGVMGPIWSPEAHAAANGLALAAPGNPNQLGGAMRGAFGMADAVRQGKAQQQQVDEFLRNQRVDRNNAQTREGLAGLGRGLLAQAGAALNGQAAPLLGGAGRLIQFGAQIGKGMAKALQEGPYRQLFQSQSFGAAGDFAHFAIQKALSDPEDTQKKQLEALEQARDNLEAVKGGIITMINLMQNAKPMGAILRGAS